MYAVLHRELRPPKQSTAICHIPGYLGGPGRVHVTLGLGCRDVGFRVSGFTVLGLKA